MNKNEIIEFPCSFPIKVIGTNNDSFADEIRFIIESHVVDMENTEFAFKESGQSNFISITVTVLASSQDMLDNLYRALSAHPEVKMVL